MMGEMIEVSIQVKGIERLDRLTNAAVQAPPLLIRQILVYRLTDKCVNESIGTQSKTSWIHESQSSQPAERGKQRVAVQPARGKQKLERELPADNRCERQ